MFVFLRSFVCLTGFDLSVTLVDIGYDAVSCL